MNVLEQITDRLSSDYSIDKYMGNFKWDLLKKGLLKLSPEGVVALQVAGRFDIASNAVYGDPMLDWILMVYNNVRKIGYDEGLDVKRTIPLTLAAGANELLDITLRSENFTIVYGELVIPHTDEGDDIFWVDLDGDGNNDLKMEYSPAAVKITNVSASSRTFRLVYSETVYSDDLSVGTIVSFPSKADIDSLLSTINAQEQMTVTGFARL